MPPDAPAQPEPPTTDAAALGPILARLAAVVEGVGAADVEGLDAAHAATFVGVSRSKFHELVSRGLAPAPVELGDGRCPRWCRSELRAWLLAGAPPRARWAMMRDVTLRRAG